jgi:hypothetical protein
MPRNNAPATIIMRALANIPGIKVPTDKQDLISFPNLSCPTTFPDSDQAKLCTHL